MYGSVHSLSAASDVSKQQVQKLHSDLAAVTEKHRQAAETVRRLSRKFLLVSKVITSISLVLLVH